MSLYEITRLMDGTASFGGTRSKETPWERAWVRGFDLEFSEPPPERAYMEVRCGNTRMLFHSPFFTGQGPLLSARYERGERPQFSVEFRGVSPLCWTRSSETMYLRVIGASAQVTLLVEDGTPAVGKVPLPPGDRLQPWQEAKGFWADRKTQAILQAFPEPLWVSGLVAPGAAESGNLWKGQGSAMDEEGRLFRSWPECNLPTDATLGAPDLFVATGAAFMPPEGRCLNEPLLIVEGPDQTVTRLPAEAASGTVAWKFDPPFFIDSRDELSVRLSGIENTGAEPWMARVVFTGVYFRRTVA